MNKIYLSLILLIIFIVLSQSLFAQKNDSSNTGKNSYGGVVTIQTKGISTIPNLTLGKPAVIFDMKIGRKLTFEPQFRFSLKGEPWAIVFWWRYNPAISNKFSLNFSANHSLSYKDISVLTDTAGSKQEIIRTTRYMAGAITPVYKVNKYINLGMYLFYTYGIEKFITRHTWMVSFRPGISNIPLARNIVAAIGPDIYYLKMDDKDGMYFTSRFSISKKNFPVSISALVTKTLDSDITSEYDFLWNVGISYSFSY